MDTVSIIIPCYNQGKYLHQALASIHQQDYPHKEVIVVNDGSTDNTEAVAKSYPFVKYVFQTNAGAAAARNTGIAHSTGAYFIFLDADDILLPGGISEQVRLIEERPDVAFVSGGHYMLNSNLEPLKKVASPIQKDLFECMLEGNFIGMHASVLYRRFIFEKYTFDPHLRVSEDYDLYFTILDQYPIYNHQFPVAGYRRHNDNCSGNPVLMLEASLHVLERQKPRLRTAHRRQAYRQGKFNWIYYYGNMMYEQLLFNPSLEKERREVFIRTFWKYRPIFYFKYLFHKYVRKVPA
jgi:glycosyltransferase involved in cell wall biosynthesis